MNDEDLYCLECGYNLRGQEGDPRRCPECGTSSMLEALRIPAGVLRAQAKKLETLPNRCAAEMVFMLVVTPYLFHHSREAGYAVIVLGLTAWGADGFAFARGCDYRSGWVGALATIHLAALLLTAGVLLICAGFVIPIMGPPKWRIISTLGIVLGTFLIVGGVIVRRNARRRLLNVKRSAAVKMAKRELERRCSAP